MKRIALKIPRDDARRERVERAVFSQLSTMRLVDRADAATAEPRSRARLALAAGLAAAVAAVAVALVMWRGRAPTREVTAVSPSLVTTPVGGASRFTVGDAVIDAGSDTSVRVATDPDGAVTLVLARGSVDCDVAPRRGRPPFRVVAGDVTVEVVGTRFTVSRTPAVRVDVARGKVKVIGPTGTSFVPAGDSWPVETASVAPAGPAASIATPNVGPDQSASAGARTPLAAPPVQPAPPSPRAEFEKAQRIRTTDPDGAARLYREVADDRGPWAALALYDLAEMHADTRPDTALHQLDQLAARFPHAANAEDAAWLRIEVLSKAGRGADAQRAAADYLRAFPAGTYVEQARHMARP